MQKIKFELTVPQAIALVSFLKVFINWMKDHNMSEYEQIRDVINEELMKQ